MTQHIGHIMKLISDRMRINADADFKEHNITLPQARIIKFLSRNGGSATQKAIEEHLGVSHPTVAGIVSRMEKNGYLECRTDENDKRNKIVKLTKKAVCLDAELKNSIDKREMLLLKGLSAEQTEELRRMLNILYNNINDKQEGDAK